MNPILFLAAVLLAFSLSVTHSFECTSTTTTTATTLKCDLKTLQSRFDSTQLSAAKKLEIRCSDLFIFESQLSSEHFGKLPDLEELSIESCKIRHVPARAFAGLTRLKRLRLQSYSSLVMDIDVESFKKVNILEDLDLTHNNIWSLPSGMLCEMSSLRRLNLSNNHLMEPSDLGIASCRIALLFLDLSQNYLTSLTKEDLSQMPSLERLNLSLNQINSLSENAFFGVEHLKEVDLSHNQISALPSGLFNKSFDLERLFLQNNSLSMIHPDLLVGLTNLQVLNLSGNAISSQLISRETFSSLASLNTLDLSFNQLSKLGEDVFASLTSLQRLYLQNNFIVKIDGGNVFANQVQLKVLDLSRNKMSAVNDKLFSSLTNLVTLRIYENSFQDLNNVTFKCSNVVELSFQHNLLTSVPSFIANCQSVKRLDLSDNKIVSINNKTFPGLVNLIELNLSGNQLSHLDNQTFSSSNNSSSSIQILNLSKNKLTTVGRSALDGLDNLNVLSLNENFLADLNGILSHLGHLELLNVSTNKVEWFDFAFLPNSLTWLDISNNMITDLSNFYSLKNFRLQVLEASNNRVARLNPESFPESLVHVLLDGNQISEIEPDSISHLEHLQSVDLRFNKIQHLTSDAFTTTYKNVNGRPKIFLYGNPFACDCYLDWLPSINEDSHRQLPIVPDLDDLTCHNSNNNNDNDLPRLLDVQRDQFLCPYETHCFDLCMCCDFYACDCRMQCPYGCQCEHDRNWSVNAVKCSNKNHTHIPLLIPMDATSLHLDGNRLHYIDQQNFLGRQRVQKLFLNSSGVVRLSEAAFTGLTDLRVLHLQDNKLSELRGFEFTGLVHLRELYLEHNALTFINDMTFEPLLSLQVLRLDGNMLTSFNVWKLKANNLLSSLALSENLWSCDCDFIAPFSEFLEKRKEIVADYESIHCLSNDVIREGVREGEPCSSSSLRKSVSIPDDDEDEFSWATVLIPASLAALMLIMGFLAVCVFRKSINTWLYNKSSEIYESNNSRPVNNNVSSTDSSQYSQSKLFDVYVSYSVQDAYFVHNSLSQVLEHGNNSSKVCLHHRDFPHGAPLHETTALVGDSSDHIIIVLTESYIESDEWLSMKESLLREVNKDKIIFLLIQDVGNHILYRHNDLCQWLAICPVVRWGAPGFLNQLKYFLPQLPQMTFQRNITLRANFPTLSQVPKIKRQCSEEHPIEFRRSQPNFGHLSNNLMTIGSSVLSQPSFPAGTHTYQTLPARSNVVERTNFGLVLRVEAAPLKSSPNVLPSVCHAYTHSTSSGQQLLAASEAEEYLV